MIAKKNLKQYVQMGELKKLIKKEKDPNKQIKACHMLVKYFHDLKNEISELQDSIEDNPSVCHCNECDYYFSSPKDVSTRKVVRNICIYSDAGYGDMDEYADVVYFQSIVSCPKCKEIVVMSETMGNTVPGTKTRPYW